MNGKPRFLIVCADHRSNAGTLIAVIENAGGEVDCTYRATQYRKKFNPAKHSGLILLGNDTGSADDRRRFSIEMDWASAAMERGRALLGICHGAQLVSHVLGGKLSKWATLTDRGLTPISVTAEGANDPALLHVRNVMLAQWHYHAFSPPDGAVELVRSTYPERQHCEAFRFGTNVYALQFHPEPTAKQLTTEWKLRQPAETVAAAEKAGRAVLESWVAIALRSG